MDVIINEKLPSSSFSQRQPWNPFVEPSVDISSMGGKQSNEPLAAALSRPSDSEQYLAFGVPSVIHLLWNNLSLLFVVF